MSFGQWGPANHRNPGSAVYFEGEFGRLFAYAFFFAAPVLIVLYVIDLGMGFLNRFA